MATEIKLWKVQHGALEQIQQQEFSAGHVEKDLEDWIAQTPDLLGEPVLIIDRQRNLPGVGILDLLGIDRDGTVVIVELKRDRTPREAVAQALHYASWFNDASEEQVLEFAHEYLEKQGTQLEEEFNRLFGKQFTSINPQDHRVVLVAPKLDTAAEAIINYLSERHGVDINAVFFTYSKVDGTEILARALLVSEETAQVRVAKATRNWTVGELRTAYSEVTDPVLRKRLPALLDWAVQHNCVAPGRGTQNPVFAVVGRNEDYWILSVAPRWIYPRLHEKRWSTLETRDQFVADLKRIDLYPSDFLPEPTADGKNTRKLEEWSDQQFAAFLDILGKYCRAQASAATSNR